ncbi:MAG: signal peptidase II [bacterium]
MFFFLTAFLAILVDQFTKLAVQSHMYLGQSFPFLGRVVYLTYVRNTGGAFSLLRGKSLLFIVVGCLVLAAMLIFIKSILRLDKTWIFSLGLIAGGTAGNLIDRFRLSGAVVDFIDFRFFPVFNAADSAITIGMVILALNVIFFTKEK